MTPILALTIKGNYLIEKLKEEAGKAHQNVIC